MNKSRDMLFYDGDCGMCRRTAAVLRALDWLHRLEFQDMTAVDDAVLPVPRERATQGIPMRTRNGRAFVGFPAVRRALIQTPLGALPACAMYLPGLSHLGAAVYRQIATRRRRDHACAVPQDQR